MAKARSLTPPVREQSLSLAKLARFLSRVSGEVHDLPEIYQDLLGAFWTGHLQARRHEAGQPVSRFEFLGTIAHYREHSGFSFLEPSDAVPPKVTMNPDGTASIDNHRYIVLPSDPSLWTEAVLERAYAELASVAFDGYHEHLQPVVISLTVTKDDFGSYYDRTARPRPLFWFRPDHRSERARRMEQEVGDWLISLSNGRKKKSKRAYFKEARGQFPRLAYKAFERAWDASVPQSWKEGGALTKRQKEA